MRDGTIGLGVAGRLGAGALVVGMVVAIAAAGPNAFSVFVLVAAAGIVLVGTGPYSCWHPTLDDLLGDITVLFAPAEQPPEGNVND